MLNAERSTLDWRALASSGASASSSGFAARSSGALVAPETTFAMGGSDGAGAWQ